METLKLVREDSKSSEVKSCPTMFFDMSGSRWLVEGHGVLSVSSKEFLIVGVRVSGLWDQAILLCPPHFCVA